MNERFPKQQKKTYKAYHLEKNPSVKALLPHCLPKDPPNITAFAHYAHPRKHDLKENSKHHHNQQHREQHHKNVLLQPRKSNQGDDCLRKTQKRIRNRPIQKS